MEAYSISRTVEDLASRCLLDSGLCGYSLEADSCAVVLPSWFIELDESCVVGQKSSSVESRFPSRVRS
jgi:hypothetical protein